MFCCSVQSLCSNHSMWPVWTIMFLKSRWYTSIFDGLVLFSVLTWFPIFKETLLTKRLIKAQRNFQYFKYYFQCYLVCNTTERRWFTKVLFLVLFSVLLDICNVDTSYDGLERYHFQYYFQCYLTICNVDICIPRDDGLGRYPPRASFTLLPKQFWDIVKPSHKYVESFSLLSPSHMFQWWSSSYLIDKDKYIQSFLHSL